jgi:outer membrane usher protein
MPVAPAPEALPTHQRAKRQDTYIPLPTAQPIFSTATPTAPSPEPSDREADSSVIEGEAPASEGNTSQAVINSGESVAPRKGTDSGEVIDSSEGVPPSEGETSKEIIVPGAATDSGGVEESAETEEELFERVFGTPPPQSQAVAVPFFINDQPQGQVIVVAAGGRASRVQAPPLLASTAPILQPVWQNQLIAAVDGDGYLALDQLQQIGIDVIFDQSKLELYLQIPPELRAANVVDSTGLPPEAVNALPISPVSGYVNLRGGQDILWSGSGQTGRQPLRLSLDGVLNVSGWVLEGQADVIEAGSPGLVRRDIRLVHDDTVNALRYTAGDLTVPVSGSFQTVVPLMGLSVSRNYSIQPYRVTRPTGEFSFFLERPSQVDVYINGVRVQQLQLEAGPQDIRNIALSTGANDIQLIITDDLGQVQQLDFSAALASSLLAPGLQQFSYNLGLPSDVVNGQRQYQWDEPQLALSHRWGINASLTLGAYTQLTPSFQMVETDGVWASAIGNWGWDFAASHTNTLGTGMAARLRYELPPHPQDPTDKTFRIAAEYQDDRFTSLTSISPSEEWLILSGSYSQTIFDHTTLNLGGAYRLGRNQSDTYNANIGLSSSFGHGLSGSVNCNYSRDPDGQTEARVFLGMLWIIPQRNQSVTLNTTLNSTAAMSNQLSWNRNPRRRIGGTGLALDLSRGSQSTAVTGSLNYTDYRFDLELTQDFSWSRQVDPLTNASRLTFGTALVFADGHFSWSRPINNSFVMVVPSERWRGQVIGVNPIDDYYLGVVDRFGPAVLPDLQPYYVSDVTLEALEAPLGYDLGTSEYVVMPSYRSGTVIRAGTEAAVFIRGVLTDETGEPLALQAGQVVSLSDADWIPQPVFTNRVGRFALLGLTPGRYEIHFAHYQPIQFDISAEQIGLVDLGTLLLLPLE